jgi:hypothetical protein
LARFLGSFFAARQRMNIKNPHSARATLCARQKEKTLKISTNLCSKRRRDRS